MLSSFSVRQPRGHGESTLRKAGPSTRERLRRLAHQVARVVRRGLGHIRDAVRDHDLGEVLALLPILPLRVRPTGLVVVQAPAGVALERWKPVFM